MHLCGVEDCSIQGIVSMILYVYIILSCRIMDYGQKRKHERKLGVSQCCRPAMHFLCTMWIVKKTYVETGVSLKLMCSIWTIPEQGFYPVTAVIPVVVVISVIFPKPLSQKRDFMIFKPSYSCNSCSCCNFCNFPKVTFSEKGLYDFQSRILLFRVYFNLSRNFSRLPNF